MAAAIKKAERGVFNCNKAGNTPAKKLATKTKLIAAAGRVFTCFFTLCFRLSAPIPLPHSLATRALKSPELFFTATMTDRPCASAGGDHAMRKEDATTLES